MSIEWSEDGHEIDMHLDRRSRGIDEKAVIALDSALQTLFAETQALVHVISGRLRSSGRVDSHVNEGVWEGEISYGNGIVDYAWYEARRGGSHDFMRSVRESPHIGVAFRVGLED